MILYSLRGLKVAIYCQRQGEVKKLLLSIGIPSQTYDPSSPQDWQVIIADYESYVRVPSSYLRIILADCQLEQVEGHIICIPASPDLKAIHWALVEAARLVGLQDPAYY
ncbi:hypothetical protein [Candidatus Odyssella thessalonicensis]|uniref:hypothetical protein n=1 Tax=Candidatus Odyssella thessalonicensis TaxID=84647 RepID=UPI000225ABE7|nr:hypothetical protein [Candidatus Odyssella thessalonicensis]